jgi:hypothetical protein
VWIVWRRDEACEVQRLAMPFGGVQGIAFAAAGLILVAVYERPAVCAWELEWELDVPPANFEP